MGILDRLGKRIFRDTIDQAVRSAMAVAETENNFLVGVRSASDSYRDRFTYDRNDTFEQALEAWRVNPLARRIVELTTQYVVGGGIAFDCKDEQTRDYLEKMWVHPLNQLEVRISEWCDELARTGNLFILLSTDAAGMSYFRAVPATNIERIESADNDVEQELLIYPKASLADPDPAPWEAYHPDIHDSPDEAGKFGTVMLHYAVNRPVGAQWGESDLAPLLRWLARYANWLEDRARLNRFRTAFLYVVKARFASEAERLARQRTLNANPPKPGSILVCDESEEWSVIEPALASQDAMNDGMALKKMIAAGSGVPMHFLAEPESATRTTAEAAGGPTYRKFEQRQKYFLWMLEDLMQIAIRRRAKVDRKVKADADLLAKGADISARDNISLALAVSNIVVALGKVRNRGLIDDAEYLRLIYRFAGEAVDVEDMLERGEEAGPIYDPEIYKDADGEGGPKIDINPDTGELLPSKSGENI